MNKAERVLEFVFLSGDQSAIVLQPGKRLLPKALRVGNFHATKLAPPSVEARLRKTVPPARILDLDAALGLTQKTDDLLSAVALLQVRPTLPMAFFNGPDGNSPVCATQGIAWLKGRHRKRSCIRHWQTKKQRA